MAVRLVLTEGAEPGRSFLAASGGARGEGGFLLGLAWTPTAEDTHRYLEALGATVATGLSFRCSLLPGVLLLMGSGETEPALTTLAAGEGPELLCLGSAPPPPKLWLFTHMNLDFFSG